MENILTEIDAFLADTGMGASTFGTKAVSDGKLVGDLRGRNGKQRELRKATEAKVRAFIESERMKAAA